MTNAQKMQNFRTRAAQYRARAKEQLRKLMRSGSPQAGSFTPQWGAYGDRAAPAGVELGSGGRLNIRTGGEPTDADVDNFIRTTGGNPYESKMQSFKARVQKNSDGGLPKAMGRMLNKQIKTAEESQQSQTGQPSLVERFVADITAKDKEANAANQLRYDRLVGADGSPEGTGLFGQLRTDRQGLAEGLGTAASADIDERMKESLSNIKAELAQTGNANSNVGSAFAQRVARDTANEQQRVKEAVARMKAGMLADDTDRIGGVVERRNDVGPDFSQFLPLLLEHGKSGYGSEAAQAAAAEATAQQPVPRRRRQRLQQAPPLNYYGGGGGYGYGGGAVFLNGNPLQQAQGMYGGGGGYQQGYGAPMEYGDAGPGDYYAPTHARMAREEAQKQARISGRQADMQKRAGDAEWLQQNGFDPSAAYFNR